MTTTLQEMVREQILAEGPDLASEQDWPNQAAYDARVEEYVDEQLNALTNVQLLERISDAFFKASTTMAVRPWL